MKRVIRAGLDSLVEGQASQALCAAIERATVHATGLFGEFSNNAGDISKLGLVVVKAFQSVASDEAKYAAALDEMVRTDSAQALAAYLNGRDAAQAVQVSAALPVSLRQDGTSSGLQAVNVVHVGQWNADVEMAAP
jgi:hypothetical protein